MPTAGQSGDQPDFASVYGDDDIDWAPEILFRDHDGLMLVNVSLDGIEDDSSEVAEKYRFANLHPRDWFDAFADVTDS